MFAVVVTGPPGAGKTAALTALSEALVEDEIAHAAIDVDEVAWAFPFPEFAHRNEYLRGCWEVHRRAGQDLLLVAEVVLSRVALGDLLASVGADDHLLARLEARLPILRERIIAREPPGWSSLEFLLELAEQESAALAGLDCAHVVLDSERLTTDAIAARIRSACPERLGG